MPDETLEPQPATFARSLAITHSSFGVGPATAFVDRGSRGNAQITIVAGGRHVSMSGPRVELQRLIVSIDTQLTRLSIQPEPEVDD